jgi:hypothetical protein
VPVHFPLNVVNQKKKHRFLKKKITMSRNIENHSTKESLGFAPFSLWFLAKKTEHPLTAGKFNQRLHRSLALSRPWPSQTSWRNSPAKAT